MKKNITLFFLLLVELLYAQDSLKYNLVDVVITSLHRPTDLFEVNKNIDIIGTGKITTSPVSSVQDLLEYSNSVQLNQRGANGVQADIGIRGGNFEQTLIMLDGIKIIDPQTGHHNLNLPITTLNIEQIEIVKGNSSNINGANAFSGLVNFKTKRNRFNSLIAQAEGGDFGLYSGSLFGSYNIGKLSNNIAIEKNHSDGYRENTEYDITNFSYGGSFTGTNRVFDVFLGYTDKSFGANSFYTVEYPLQYEHIKTTFAKASVEFGENDLNYSVKIYWRKNDDEFLLDKTNPLFYKNNHTTNIYGGEVDIFIKSNIGGTSVGSELVYDKITSSNLGNHNRERVGVFFAHIFKKYKNFSLGINGYFYNYTTIGWKFLPGADLTFAVNKQINLFANYSKGLRIPTYTELFYSSPTTLGNAYLKYEEIINYELGIKYFSGDIVSFSTTLFYKDASNLIDWVIPGLDAPWMAMNIAELKTSGIEINLDLDLSRVFLPINSLELKYSYLNSNYNNDNHISRYLLNYLEHQAIISFDHYLPFDLDVYWNLRFEKRYDSESNFITDLRINRTFDKFLIYIKITNLFDVEYYDFVGIPMPGRWFSGGITYGIE